MSATLRLPNGKIAEWTTIPALFAQRAREQYAQRATHAQRERSEHDEGGEPRGHRDIEIDGRAIGCAELWEQAATAAAHLVPWAWRGATA